MREKEQRIKKKVMISFQEGNENGGPYTSHTRIMNSKLNNLYEYVPLFIPKGRIGVLNICLLHNLMKQIKEANPDLVHIHGLQLAGFHYALAAYLCGKPIVLAVRGSTREAIHYAKWKKFFVSILEVATLKMSSVVYGVSDYVCSWDMIRKYAKNKLYGTIYNMMQIEESTENNNEINIREELGISTNDIVIVSTGRITEEKGYKILCEAIIEMKDNSNLKFVIVGDGSYLEEFRQTITQEGLIDRVFFMGYQKNVNPFLKSADIFVICSLHETLCNSLIEAGAVGLPLIAPRAGGIPEVVKPNITGMLLEENTADCVANAIQRLSNNNYLREKYGKMAKEHIRVKFGQDSIVGQIHELYEKCIGGG